MKIFSVNFEPLWPVGGCLIIAAEDIEEAKSIAKETITHTDEFEVIEEDISKSGVIIYLSGDY
jgi:hypothetical protein